MSTEVDKLKDSKIEVQQSATIFEEWENGDADRNFTKSEGLCKGLTCTVSGTIQFTGWDDVELTAVPAIAGVTYPWSPKQIASETTASFIIGW
jgi:hypothetical protein